MQNCKSIGLFSDKAEVHVINFLENLSAGDQLLGEMKVHPGVYNKGDAVSAAFGLQKQVLQAVVRLSNRYVQIVLVFLFNSFNQLLRELFEVLQAFVSNEVGLLKVESLGVSVVEVFQPFLFKYFLQGLATDLLLK